MGLPMRFPCGDKPVFRFAVDLIVMRAMGSASGHFNPVCIQILASLFFRNPFCLSTAPQTVDGKGSSNAV